MEPAQLTGTRMLPCSRSIKIKIPGTLVPAITGIAFPWGLSSVQGPPCRCDSGGARTSPAAVRRQRQRRPPDNGARLRHRLATKLHEAFPFSCPGAAGAVAESGPPTCSAAAPPPPRPAKEVGARRGPFPQLGRGWTAALSSAPDRGGDRGGGGAPGTLTHPFTTKKGSSMDMASRPRPPAPRKGRPRPPGRGVPGAARTRRPRCPRTAPPRVQRSRSPEPRAQRRSRLLRRGPLGPPPRRVRQSGTGAATALPHARTT